MLIEDANTLLFSVPLCLRERQAHCPTLRKSQPVAFAFRVTTAKNTAATLVSHELTSSYEHEGEQRSHRQ